MDTFVVAVGGDVGHRHQLHRVKKVFFLSPEQTSMTATHLNHCRKRKRCLCRKRKVPFSYFRALVLLHNLLQTRYRSGSAPGWRERQQTISGATSQITPPRNYKRERRNGHLQGAGERATVAKTVRAERREEEEDWRRRGGWGRGGREAESR